MSALGTLCTHDDHDNRAQLKRMSYLLIKVDKNATTYILNQNQEICISSNQSAYLKSAQLVFGGADQDV